MKRIALSVVVAALLAGSAAACGATHPSARPVTTTTTVVPATTDPSTTAAPPTSAAPIDVSTVPAQITVPYINAVFVALNHVEGDVGRADLAAHTSPRSSLAMLRAIYADSALNGILEAESRIVAGDTSNFVTPLGDGVTTVNEVLKATSTCIFVETTSDSSKVVKHQTPAIAEYYTLTPKVAADDPQHYNPTAWMIAANAEELSDPISVTVSP